MTTSTRDRPTSDDLEGYRRELTGYCYRMLGAASEAEDAVQETLVKAWQALGRFEGRSSVRTWLYRIATNVCMDHHRSPQRRARPMDLGPAAPPEASRLTDVRAAHEWVLPVADAAVIDPDGDPATVAEAREALRLAFVAALQLLPPKQRAALILCDVLHWSAQETADLLDTTVPAINSALQRARATLAEHDGPPPDHSDQEALVEQYVAAFERYDLDRLVSLLRDDVVMSMPPHTLWLQGPEAVRSWLTGPGSICEDSTLVPIALNGSPAFVQYHPDDDGVPTAWSLIVLDTDGTHITGIHHFLTSVEPDLVSRLGARDRLPT